MTLQSREINPRDSAGERLRRAAAKLFYGHGIRGVGVDRVVEVAGVTRATFYRHFPGKEDLVVAYLEAEDAAVRALADEARAGIEDPDQLLARLVEITSVAVCGPDFRGCPFINAAAEYPDPDSPVRRVIDAHRCWLADVLTEVLTSRGDTDPSGAARTLIMLRDGALVAGYLDDPRETIARLTEAVHRLVARQ